MPSLLKHLVATGVVATALITLSDNSYSQETKVSPNTKVNQPMRTARVKIKSVNIEAPFDKVFSFISNPMNWPKYAIVNMKAVTPGKDGWFSTVTKFGTGELKVNAVYEYGLFDHVWRDPQASWTVPARVVQNNGGSTVEMTIFQPPVMNDTEFDEAMAEMDIELNKLKELLEAADPADSKLTR